MGYLATQGSRCHFFRNTIMKIKEAAFVAYPVTDLTRARAFYEKVLGLTVGELDHEISSMPGKHWVEYELGNVTLALSNAWEPSGQSGPTLALEVDDFDAAMAELKDAGVTIVMEKLESPFCYFGLITDPDGNSLTIHQRKPGHH